MSEKRRGKLQAQISKAHTALLELATARCPGTHHPVQHRDGKPPWCPDCGKTAEGDTPKSRL